MIKLSVFCPNSAIAGGIKDGALGCKYWKLLGIGME
jgi:hypothetical protein